MAVGLKEAADLSAVAGVEIAVTGAQIRYSGRDDLVLIRLSEGSKTAALFTQNKYCAAPVVVAKRHLGITEPRALLINSGNANAGTGKQGLTNAEQSCAAVARQLGIETEQVMPFSTGVIAEQLPMSNLLNGIAAINNGFDEDNWLSAAKAIMTTDTLAKGVSEKIEIDGETITITGIAKGSGMICPDMATMLAYVATDAAISSEVLNSLLQQANQASFNRITVDSDTSTNDALVLMATGMSNNAPIESVDSSAAKVFYLALERILIELATRIVRDGEGASKFVKVSVNSADSAADAEQIAYSVAHSPLVKTALFASDPNWGRILAAVGKTNLPQLDMDKVDLKINQVAIVAAGERVDSYTEQAGKSAFAEAEIEIVIGLNMGDSHYHVWTSDLSHDYVSINADYRS